jgi:hypothetical protein
MLEGYMAEESDDDSRWETGLKPSSCYYEWLII